MVNIKELLDKHQVNCDRIREMADTIEKEKRERTEAETREYEALMRENQLLQMRIAAATDEHYRENPNAKEDAIKIIRENAKLGGRTEITVMREVMMVKDLTSGSIVPLKMQDILKPLTEGFILDKVGLPMPTGLSGDYFWPSYDMVEAQVAGEGVALADKKINFSKLTAKPERVGIAIPVTNQALNQSDGLLEMIIREIMPRSIRLLLNKILFSTKVVNSATTLKGPFVDKFAHPVILGVNPSYEKFNKDMKAKVLETGVEGEELCWIMTKSMQAVLEGTPINEKGIHVPMVQDGKLCGLPIYTTNCMREAGVEYIGLGDWRYQPMGLFGDVRFIVNPFSKAREDAVDFVLNTEYGTTTLRPEAFLLGKVAAE